MSDDFLMFAMGISAVMVAVTLLTGMVISFINKFFPSNAELTRRITENRMAALDEGAARGECMSLLGLTGKPKRMAEEEIHQALGASNDDRNGIDRRLSIRRHSY